MFFGPNNSKKKATTKLELANTSIELVSEASSEKSFKFLGVYLDECLTWQHHINHVTKKLNKGIFIINRFKHFFPYHILRMLYFSLIYSHLTYGIIVWGNSVHSPAIFRLQKKVIRSLHKAHFRSHTHNFFVASNLLKLEDIYKNQVALFMYNYFHGKLPASFLNFFPLHNHQYNTRGNNQLTHGCPRTTFSSKLPKHNFPKIWRNLDINLVNLALSNKHLVKQLHRIALSQYSLTHQHQCDNPMCADCRGNR